MIDTENMEFVIYLTFRCNFDCNMCFQNAEFKKTKINELTVDEWNFLFDTLVKKIEHPTVVFMGGEPLLYKDFGKILSSAFEKGIYTNVITNAYFLENYLDIIKETDTGMTVSIHGFEKTHNNIVNNNNSFQKTISALEKITKIKENKRYKNLFCRTNSLILPENIDEAKDFILYLEQFNLNDIRFEHTNFLSEITEKNSWQRCSKLNCAAAQHLQLNVKKNYNFTEGEFLNKLTEFYQWVYNKKGGKKIIESPNFSPKERLQYYHDKEVLNIRKNRLCANPWNVPFILPNGDVQNCLYSTIGNFLEEDFWDIWFGKKAESLRISLKENGNLPSCTRCCCYYDRQYIYAPNCILKLSNGKTIKLKKEMTIVPSTTDGYFILDREAKNLQDNIFPVKAIPFNSTKEKKKIEREQTIIGNFSDMV